MSFVHLLAPLLASAQIHLDLAAGPCARLVPSPFRETRAWLPGIALDAAAVVPGDIARAKAPKSARRFIDKHGELRVRPWWLAVIPQEVLTAPGDSISVFGARWALFGLDAGLSLGRPASLRLGLDLLSMDWTHLSGPAFSETENVWNLGTAAKATLELFPRAPVGLECGWVQQIGIPTDRWNSPDRSARPWTAGTARILLHGRIPLSVRL